MLIPNEKLERVLIVGILLKRKNAADHKDQQHFLIGLN